MFKLFQNYPFLKYGLSLKPDGPMELADAGLSRASNRQIFFGKINIDSNKTVSPGQCHSNVVKTAGQADAGKTIEAADGLVTNQSNLFLTITVADCFPVYFFDPSTQTLGLAHCGWRGIVKNIAANTVRAIGFNAQNLLAGIGPGIQACHFEITEEILNNFAGYPEAIIRRDDKIFVNLPKIIRSQLVIAGLKPANIENSAECTYCLTDKYLSFRRDRLKTVQAMIAYIGL